MVESESRREIQTMEEKTLYSKRLAARTLDFLLVWLIVSVARLFSDFNGINPLVAFFAYNIVVIVFDGQSVGKYIFSMDLISEKKGVSRIFWLSLREIFILPLLPLIALNAVNTVQIPLHDLLTGSKVVRDEVK